MSYYEIHELEKCELPFIFREVVYSHLRVLLNPTHWHENIEIIHIVEGNGIITNNGHVLRVSEGDVVVVNSNHLHTIVADGRPMRFRYLIVDRSFCVMNRFDTNKINFDILIRDESISTALKRIHAIYQIAEEEPYRVLQIRSAILHLMYLLCKEHSKVEPSSRATKDHNTAHIKKVIEYIHASYEKDFSLEDVANFAGMHKSYISREFHKYTGYSFVEYVGKTRCTAACRLLLDDQYSILEIGQRCGFHNMSYFAKCFKKHIGMLPSEYRESKTAPITTKFLLL